MNEPPKKGENKKGKIRKMKNEKSLIKGKSLEAKNKWKAKNR